MSQQNSRPIYFLLAKTNVVGVRVLLAKTNVADVQAFLAKTNVAGAQVLLAGKNAVIVYALDARFRAKRYFNFIYASRGNLTKNWQVC